MAIIQLLVAVIILGIVYKKMMKWNASGAISKKQAYVPAALGVLSTVLAFFAVLGIALLCIHLGYTTKDLHNPVIYALVSAFLKAGLTEELTKLLMILLSIRLFRPRSVYECALIGGAVGIGFTLHEELLYGGSLLGFSRLLTVFVHTSLGIIMGKYIGMGTYSRQHEEPYKSNYALAVIIPVAIHTLYDACTACNPTIEEADTLNDDTLALGLLIGLVSVLCAAIWQFKVIKNLKKNAVKYSEMILRNQ